MQIALVRRILERNALQHVYRLIKQLASFRAAKLSLRFEYYSANVDANDRIVRV